MGRFHGEFYAVKHTEPSKFDALKANFEESRFRFEHTSDEWDTLLKIGPKRAMQSVRNNNSVEQVIPERFLCKLEKMLADPFNYQRRSVQPKEPLATLCHGDYLRNNIAFLYSHPNGPKVKGLIEFLLKLILNGYYKSIIIRIMYYLLLKLFPQKGRTGSR